MQLSISKINPSLFNLSFNSNKSLTTLSNFAASSVSLFSSTLLFLFSLSRESISLFSALFSAALCASYKSSEAFDSLPERSASFSSNKDKLTSHSSIRYFLSFVSSIFP